VGYPQTAGDIKSCLGCQLEIFFIFIGNKGRSAEMQIFLVEKTICLQKSENRIS
jgi:hypothetical protein